MYRGFNSLWMSLHSVFFMEYFFYELCFVPLAPFGSLGVPLGCPWGALGRPLPGNVSNSRNCHQKTAFWNLPAVPPDPADPADPAEVVSASAAQTSPLHAPGVRMTGVKQTPSNDAGVGLLALYFWW